VTTRIPLVLISGRVQELPAGDTISTGITPLTLGGTNANLTASLGGILYSTATALAILAGVATAGQILRSGASAAPTWSTATYPATATANQILHATAANVWGTNPFFTFDGTNLVAPGLNASGNTVLGVNATNDVTFYAGTWTLVNNLVQTRAHGTAAAGTTNGIEFNSTFVGDAGGTTTIRGTATTVTASGGNAISAVVPGRFDLTHAGSALLTNALCNNASVSLTSSGSVTNAEGYRVGGPTLSSTGAITNSTGFRSQDMGHATLVTNARGFLAANQTASVTLAVGFESQVTSGTGKWGFYGSGSANNAFAGNVRIGSVVAPTAPLDVTGAGLVSSTLGVGGDFAVATNKFTVAAATGDTVTAGAALIGSTLGVTGVSTFCDATATPAAGSTAARILFGTTAGFGIYYGSGAPTVSAGKGSIYLRSDGTGSTDRFYVNTNGSTTWTAFLSGA
jgi:hypothetical protein